MGHPDARSRGRKAVSQRRRRSATPASSRNGRGRIGVVVQGGFRLFSGGTNSSKSRNAGRAAGDEVIVATGCIHPKFDLIRAIPESLQIL